MKVIATAGDYLGLIAGFRKRVAELGISYETLDALAGWTDTYSTKLLAEEPAKGLGMMSFDAMLGALALRIVLVCDPAALARNEARRDFVGRRRPIRNRVQHDAIVRRDTRAHMRKMGQMSGPARMAKLSPTKRSALARNAARARWAQRARDQ